MRVLLLQRLRLRLLRPLLSTIPMASSSSVSSFNFTPQLLIFASQLSPPPTNSNSNSNYYYSSSTTTTLSVNLTHPKPYKPSSSSSSSLSCVAAAAIAVAVTTTVAPPPPPPTNKNKVKKTKKSPTPKPRSSSSPSKDAAAQLKLNWLSSLSLSLNTTNSISSSSSSPSQSQWAIGIDPDVSGALALFKPPNHTSPQVFDNPHLKLLVGKRTRRRLDPKSIIQLLQSFDAPAGTTAYLEQSTPFPNDGKLGWWSGGFNYGLWIGALVASGFSVVPVPPSLWKNHFKLSGNGSSKDDSREAACKLFPSISSQLTRKKDHGRAEALLIAAYGKGLNVSPCSPLVSEDTIP